MYTTQLELAKAKKISPAVLKSAREEGIEPRVLRDRIASGKAVLISSRINKTRKPLAVGLGLKTKVNANIGTSADMCGVDIELNKLKAACGAKTDAVMDLSTAGNLSLIRRRILKHSNAVVGTVPIYESAVNATKKFGDFHKMSADDLLETLQEQAKEGVDFFTVHCGVTRASARALEKSKRLTGVVSRGGAMLISWMKRNNSENPLYSNFDKVVKIAKEYDVVLSLGDGLRPGSILDATDKAQIAELKILGELANEANRHGVQVIIEGPGHVPINQIEKNVLLEKKYCDARPFYILGPLPTDIGLGYDHIVGAIGGALAASLGADFLCYVTKSEHLRLPNADDVREAVIVSRLAGHIADIAKGVPGALEWDKALSMARFKRDWKKQISLALDPQTAASFRKSLKSRTQDACSMCGQYCSMKIFEELKLAF